MSLLEQVKIFTTVAVLKSDRGIKKSSRICPNSAAANWKMPVLPDKFDVALPQALDEEIRGPSSST